MRIIFTEDYQQMSKKAADIVVSQIILKPDSVLGLATGSTPLGMYKQIVNTYKEGHIDFNEVTTFNLDEYYGLDKTNNQSYYYYMLENFFKNININMERVNIPNGTADDIEKECLDYERKIRNCGGIDLQVLGIGRNGHIGFNEPDLKFEALTHIVELDQQTIKDNSRFFDTIEDVPTKAISMGIKTIMRARKIVLLASGEEKADAIHGAIYGKITPELPASVLQLHPDVVFIVDKEAGSRLDLEKIQEEFL
ncbi:glucosamine-6-phosphate deaminase [Paramaledivibacter caminithermalis]|uniref:Glucosamine-6-phosphate deaminase n=1 Tax=Paramaledivibacter caminithermalis (strain DSM 15212 / CIP 107654 / DViRD3) TaxID=1121301 RepID=A0A1M6NP65_PARC5|nr:glucosamine-6-phosphate deaminase [Paramaledivibacter caminithermalis]SHJ97485.1 glucosamine-6-phosphate deaminase [Paramaledivibacter caminithermalis DSM 15212]